MSDRRQTRRQFLMAIGVGAVAVLLGGCFENVGHGPGKDARPNMIFILTDDQRWDEMSCMGHKFLKTPNMDRIRNEGVLFSNAFCTTSLCSPSRATFLTGTYAHTHGVINNNGREYDPDITPIYPELLQKSGYVTAHIGKLHMAPHNRPRRGYDHWVGFTGQGVYNDPVLNIDGEEQKVKGYITDLLSDYAIDFIKQDHDKPFCMAISHKAVHERFIPPKRHKDLYKGVKLDEPANFSDDFTGKAKWQRRLAIKDWRWRFRSSEFRTQDVPDKYPVEEGFQGKSHWWNQGGRWLNKDRCINAVDEGIGRVFEALEQTGKLENTIIVFASDNGYFLGEHRRHDKRVPYEESMRIAFIMMYSKAIKPMSTIDEPITNADLAPTLLDYAGVPIPETVEGVSLKPLLDGKQINFRKSVFHEYYVDLVHAIPRTLCVRTKDFKYITYPDLDDIDEMYDLKHDPHEMKNVSQDPKYVAKKNELKAELEKQMKETGYRTEVPDLSPERKVKAARGVMLSFSFDKISEGMLVDQSGHNIDGKLNGVTVVSDQKYSAGKFTGKNSVRVNKSKALDPSKGPWVIEVFVKASSDGAILGHGGGKNGYALFVDKGVPGVAIRNDMGWAMSTSIVDGKETCIGKWTHIVAVIKENEMKLFVNGQLADWMPVPVPLVKLPDTQLLMGQDCKVPADKELTGKPFEGLIHSLKIYRGEKKEQEIARLYKKAIAKGQQ
jgi:N-acetylglucosamine-6-sulfatase